MYSLRHSSIVRALLRNVPIRLIAATHNTSTRMIEANYSKFITEHADDISRIGLLHDEPPRRRQHRGTGELTDYMAEITEP